MSNEVIIDGVNVAECMFVQTDHYLETPCCIIKIARNEVIGICKNRPNCYFKQLQRVKAEKQEKVLKMAEAEIEIEKLQSENEKLKADIEELKESNDSYDEACRALLSDKEKLQSENEKLKSRNKLYKKIIKENIEKANNNFMILTACIQGNLSVDEVKEYAKLNAKNDELKRKLKSYKQALEDIKVDFINYSARNGFNKFEDEMFIKIDEVLNE